MGKLILFYNFIVITSLLICYLSLFGFKSLQKYLKKDVITIKEEEIPQSITPPGESASGPIADGFYY